MTTTLTAALSHDALPAATREALLGKALAAYEQNDEWPNEAELPPTDIYRLYPGVRAEVLSGTREKGAPRRNRYTMHLTWATPLPGMTPRYMVVHDPKTVHLTSQAFRRDGADRHAVMLDKLANAPALTEHLQNGAEIRWAYWRDFETKTLSECCGGRVMRVMLYSPQPLPGCCGCGYLSLSVCANCGREKA